MNNLDVLGRLTRDPETRYTQDGRAVTSFSIAVQKNKEEASFFDCVAFNETAENIGKHFAKGDRILINGRLTEDRWEKDGQKRSKVQIIVRGYDFIETKRREEPKPEDFARIPEGFGEELPFN